MRITIHFCNEQNKEQKFIIQYLNIYLLFNKEMNSIFNYLFEIRTKKY